MGRFGLAKVLALADGDSDRATVQPLALCSPGLASILPVEVRTEGFCIFWPDPWLELLDVGACSFVTGLRRGRALSGESICCGSLCGDERGNGTSVVVVDGGLLTSKPGLESDELPVLGTAGLVALVEGGDHRKEFRSVFACLERVMRKELVEEVEERLEALASTALSFSCAEEERLELD